MLSHGLGDFSLGYQAEAPVVLSGRHDLQCLISHWAVGVGEGSE